MIILYQFPRLSKLPNVSPFCLKVETFLRMMGLPYENCFVMDPRKAPKGKLPYINLSGQIIADSELILDALQNKFGNILDEHLTAEQRALGVLLDNFFSERVYWLMLYFRWQDEEGWRYLKKVFFKRLPWYLRSILPGMIRKKRKAALQAQGMGRHQRDELIFMAEKTIQAIADTLGDKKYFLGEEISSIDAAAFGFLANILWFTLDDPLKKAAQKHQNLREFCDRMWHRFYFEMDQPFQIV